MFRFVFRTLSAVSEPVVRPLLHLLERRTGLGLEWLLVGVGALVTLVVVYLVGLVGSRLAGARLGRIVSRLMARLPLVQTLYGGTKRLLAALAAAPDRPQRVVLVGSRRTGARSVGLVTSVLTDTVTGEEYAAVYLPSTPNAASGSLELVPVDEVQPSDMSLEEALSLVVSGGTITPARSDATATAER